MTHLLFNLIFFSSLFFTLLSHFTFFILSYFNYPESPSSIMGFGPKDLIFFKFVDKSKNNTEWLKIHAWDSEKLKQAGTLSLKRVSKKEYPGLSETQVFMKKMDAVVSTIEKEARAQNMERMLNQNKDLGRYFYFAQDFVQTLCPAEEMSNENLNDEDDVVTINVTERTITFSPDRVNCKATYRYPKCKKCMAKYQIPQKWVTMVHRCKGRHVKGKPCRNCANLKRFSATYCGRPYCDCNGKEAFATFHSCGIVKKKH